MFWRVPSSKILLQASLRRISDLLPLVSQSIEYRNYFTMFGFCFQHHIQKFQGVVALQASSKVLVWAPTSTSADLAPAGAF